MVTQIAGMNEVIKNVKLSSIETRGGIRYMHFTWGGGMWGQMTLPEYECITDDIQIYCRKDDKMTGRLEQYQGKYYKTYKFVPDM